MSTTVDYAALWHASIIRADTLDPDAAWRAVNGTQRATNAAPVLRAVSLDGRVSTSGHSDPTAAVADAAQAAEPPRATTFDPLSVERTRRRFIANANIVLDWVSGDIVEDWRGVVRRARRLQPGTIQAGLDVDDEYLLPPAIEHVAQAVDDMAAVCSALGCATRPPTPLERGRQAKLPDSACCTLHLSAHSAYRVPRLDGKLLCQWCDALVHAAGGKLPPVWLIDMMQTEDPTFIDGLEDWLAS
jgi:hypothetical protein